MLDKNDVRDKATIIKYLKQWNFEYDPWSLGMDAWRSIHKRYITLDLESNVWVSENARSGSRHVVHPFNCRTGLKQEK